MEKKFILTENAANPIGPYSQGIKIGNTIYTSGVIPLIPGTLELVDNNVKAATRQALENIRAIIESEGAKMEDIVRTTIFARDMSYFTEINEVYSEYFKGKYPTRSFVKAEVPRNATLMIDAIAVISEN